MLQENVYDRFPFSSDLISLFAVDILVSRYGAMFVMNGTGGGSAAASSVTNQHQHQPGTTWVSNILPASLAFLHWRSCSLATTCRQCQDNHVPLSIYFSLCLQYFPCLRAEVPLSPAPPILTTVEKLGLVFWLCNGRWGAGANIRHQRYIYTASSIHPTCPAQSWRPVQGNWARRQWMHQETMDSEAAFHCNLSCLTSHMIN